MSGEDYDFVAIGGGAAGYFGAISFAEAAPGSRVAILEKSREVLGKVRISGGGRCNVTHACFEPKPLTTHYPRGEKTLIGPFHRWASGDTIDWFAQNGVELKTEEDGRMFPTTDQSQTIIDCFTRRAEELGIEVITGIEIDSIEKNAELWRLIPKDGPDIRAQSILIATGGIRNGAGARLAGSVGHTIIQAAPSLFTFKIPDRRLEGLSGISVASVLAAIPSKKLRSNGPCLITHWGLSGPAILRLSAWGARELAESDYSFEVVINWLGKGGVEEADAMLSSAREQHPKKMVMSGLPDTGIPSRLWQRLAEMSGVGEQTTWSNLSKDARRRFANELTTGTYRVQGKSMNKDEFVTAGGVKLSEVNFKTMESRLAPGLYFAGEVLDIDGITGGFNFQSAWTTARIAGESAAG